TFCCSIKRQHLFNLETGMLRELDELVGACHAIKHFSPKLGTRTSMALVVWEGARLHRQPSKPTRRLRRVARAHGDLVELDIAESDGRYSTASAVVGPLVMSESSAIGAADVLVDEDHLVQEQSDRGRSGGRCAVSSSAANGSPSLSTKPRSWLAWKTRPVGARSGD